MSDEIKIKVTMSDDTSAERAKIKAALATDGTSAAREFSINAKSELARSSPAKLEVRADDPIDEAWRTQVRSSIKSLAADTVKIPVNADTQEFRDEIHFVVADLAETVKQKIPMDMAEADKYRMQVEATVRELSDSVKLKLKTIADEEAAKNAGDNAGKTFTQQLGKSAGGGGAAGGGGLWAVLGPVLVAGAPLVGAAAGVAFAGGLSVGLIGAVAAVAATNGRVKDQLAQFGVQLKSAAMLWGGEVQQPVSQALGTITAAFGKLAPSVSQIFANLTPDIKIFGTTIADLGNSLMPGLVSSSARLMPVFQGLDSAVTILGKSIGDSFDQISQHSVSVGTSFTLIAQIAASLMSTLTGLTGDLTEVFAHGFGSTLLSTVTELGQVLTGVAHGAMPALASAVQMDLSAFSALLGALGPVSSLLGTLGGTALTAYLNTRLLGTLQAPIASAADALKSAGTQGTLFGNATTAVGNGLGKVGQALPYVGIGLALLSTALELDAQHANDLKDASDKLATGLEQGGASAAEARKQLDAARAANDDYLKSIQDLSAAQTAGLQDSSQYGLQAGSNATQIAELSQKIDDNKQIAADALQKYNDWAAGMGLTAITSAQLSGQVGILASSTASASSNSAQLKADLDILNTAASQASQKITALSDSIALMSDHGLQKAQDYAAQFGNALDTYTQSVATATGKTFMLNGELDTNSKRGRDVLTVLEAAQTAWAGQAQSMADAGQTTGQINAALQGNAQQLYNVLHAAGLTKTQIDGLLSTYGLIPHDITTKVHADTSPAMTAVQNLIANINGRRAYITVTASGEQIINPGGGAMKFQAAGGVMGAASGRTLGDGFTLVGEQGPEIIRTMAGATVTPRSNVDKQLASVGAPSQRPSAVEVRFSGNTESALASAIMNLMRTGQIQILSQYIQK